MKITFISPTVNLTGGTRVIVIHAQNLMRLGHDVRIVSPPPKKIPLHRQAKSWLSGGGRQNNPRPQPSHLDNSGLDHRVLERWRAVTEDDVPDGDVVIATWWETAEWVNALSPGKGAKVYFIQHHEIFPYLPIARVRASYRLPLHKIVVAPWLKRVMTSEYGDDDAAVVPNSVDRTHFFAPVRGKQPVPTVGFMYATASFKGLDTCAAALITLRTQIPNLRMICFGSQPPLKQALPDCVEFFYQPSQDEIRNIYAKCDVWITASRSEGFNLPAMEAMACRTPVVATRTGWPEEAVVNHWNGILVDVDDAAAIAQGTAWILSQSDKKWRALSANAYATVASTSWAESSRMFEAALMRAYAKSKVRQYL